MLFPFSLIKIFPLEFGLLSYLYLCGAYKPCKTLKKTGDLRDIKGRRTERPIDTGDKYQPQKAGVQKIARRKHRYAPNVSDISINASTIIFLNIYD